MTPNETSPDQAVEAARAIVKRFYPEMKPDYSGRRVQIALAAMAIPTPPHTDLIARLRANAPLILEVARNVVRSHNAATGGSALLPSAAETQLLLLEAADALQAKRIPYDVDAQIAVMGLLEQGKVTVDPDGYLVLQAHASPREVEDVTCAIIRARDQNGELLLPHSQHYPRDVLARMIARTALELG